MRIGYLDTLRALAIALVVVNHTDGSWVLSLHGTTFNWWFGIVFFYCCKIAVPLFVMISGALLLGKSDSYRKIGQRLFRIAVALLVTSAAFYLAFFENRSLADYLSRFWHNGISTYFWYLYMYIGLLVTLPLLQKLCSKLVRSDYWYILAVSLGFVCLVPVIAQFVPDATYTSYLQLPLFSGYFGAFFLGRYLFAYARPTRVCAIGAAAIFLLLLAFCCLTTYGAYQANGGSGYLVMDNSSFTPILLMAACVFLLVKFFAEKRASLNDGKNMSRKRKAIDAISVCSFGMYLTHMFFIRILQPWFQSLCEYVPDIPALLLFEAIVFVFAFATTWLLRKIPGVRRIL